MTAPEAFRLAHAVRRKSGAVQRIMDAADASKVLSAAQREINRVICPILADGICSEYSYRPIACRAVFSKDPG
ncbi:MAG: hypothetical protein RLN70_10810, partial [Rhodospirillaceae bacterium]